MDALGAEARDEQDEGVEIGDLVGADRVGCVEIGDLDIGRIAQRLDVEIREGRRPVRFLEIARERDAIGGGHGYFAFAPARSALKASASALCKTQTSPE